MYLIVGLGNPGAEYERTRHNAGRMILDEFRLSQHIGDFRLEKKWNALVAEGRVGKEKVTLLKPETFINASGSAVAKAVRFFKIKPKNIFLLHDDSDIVLGQAKLSFGKNSAGHKGVESVIRALKTNEFWRFRIGIGRKKHVLAEEIVLKKITPHDRDLLASVQKKTLAALETSILDGPDIAMNDYNK